MRLRRLIGICARCLPLIIGQKLHSFAAAAYLNARLPVKFIISLSLLFPLVFLVPIASLLPAAYAANLENVASNATSNRNSAPTKPINNLLDNSASQASESFRDDDEIAPNDAPDFDFVGFDHLTTGFQLDGLHATLDCQACHTNGVFTELATVCSACHNGGFAVGKPALHIPTDVDCRSCHSAFGFSGGISGGFSANAVALFDHSLIGAATCVLCHDGISATGKPPSPLHVPSSDNCDVCHSFVAWAPAQFNHAGITQPCLSCHVVGGSAKSAKSVNHIPTSETCEICHTVLNWAPVSPVDHSGVIGVCDTCHNGTTPGGSNGQTVIGAPPSHRNFTSDCAACHTTRAWLPYTGINHDQILGSCVSCHNGVIATGKIETHITSSMQCEKCHRVTIFVPTKAVDHNEVLGSCSSCHDSSIAIGKHVTHPPTLDECDVCHKDTAWLPVFGTIDHSTYANNCISCHDGITASGKSTTHVNTADACELCHQVFPAQWTPVASAAVDHSAVIGSCISCHDSVVASGKSDLHIPTTDICGACHQQPPAQWAPVDVSAVDHAEVTGGCIGCHDTIIASGKSTTHLDTTDNCDACHAKAPERWIPVLPQNVSHADVNGDCISCHNTLLASGKTTTHISVSDLCQTCHDVGPAKWAPVAVDRVDHTQVIGSCVSCHDTVVASGKSASHMLTSNVCEACHEQSPAKWTPLLVDAFNHAEALGSCESCHDNIVATGKHPLHITTIEDCKVCHSTKAWLPSAVDHTPFTGNCISCHNGKNASGKNAAHISSSDLCEKCHLVFPGLWVTVPVQAVDHAEVIGSCLSCHDSLKASGKSATHISTTDFCDSCHQVVPAGWTPVAVAAINHNDVVGTCVSCHDSVVALGKSSAHMPTTDNCEACHEVVPAKWVPLLAAAFNHQEVSATCSVCHDSVIATGIHTLHIATAAECDTCHVTSAWLPAGVDHSSFVDNCTSCHDGITASGKGSTGAIHINSSDLCQTCHAVFPSTWIPFTSVDHTQVVGTCIDCHDTVIASGRSASHIATTTACDVCHQQAPAKWTPVAPEAVDHTAVVGSCISCHDGVIASGKSASHIETTNVCEACHQQAPSKWVPVDPTAVDHAEIVGSCISCHDGVIASGKSATHITTSEFCDACHQLSPAKWTPVAPSAVDHTQITGVCSSCHDGTLATGINATHITTTAECDTCHNSNAWIPAAVDHSAITNNCISCHDGISASGKGSTGASHINSSDLCETCHAVFPESWTPVVPSAVDHNQVQGLCSDCHDGIIASGPSTAHIPTSTVCDACHGQPPSAWVPVLPTDVDHAQVIGACSVCHDGTLARGKGTNHIATTQECDACHDSVNWLNITVIDHTGFSNNCISCHDGTNASGKSTAHITTTDTCDACHQIFPATWVPVTNAAVNHLEVLGTCVSCHDTVIASGKSAAHIASSDACELCHQQNPQLWTPVAPIAVNHTQVIGTCIDCHDRIIASGRSAQHITTTTTCQACHGSPPEKWAPLLAGAFDHTQVLGVCSSCHEGGIATGKSTTHIQTTDVCEACHGSPPSVTVWAPLAVGAFSHVEVVGICATCHNNVIATGKNTLHITTAQGCDICHTTNVWVPAVVDHSGFTGNCTTCHNGTNASGKSTTHILSSDACELCHAVLPAKWTPVAAADVDHNAVIGSCDSCHSPTGGASPKSNNHPATTNTCDVCHQVPPQTWLPFITPLNHTEVIGNCVSCHRVGGVSSGKSTNHPSTTDNCELCHTTTPLLWTPVITPLNHTEVIGSCVSCHAPGGTATPKSTNHPSTTDNCELCHTTTPLLWTPVITPLNHAEVVGSCVSCHTPGGIAAPKSANHPSTTDNCELCHTVTPLQWTPVITPLNHTEVLGSCVSCHTPGGIATPKSANHPSTSNNCELCHTMTPLQWTPVISPLNHNEVLGSCVSCHTPGGSATPKSTNHPSTTDTCELCHTVAPLQWTPVISPLNHTEVLGSCVSCHTPGGIATPKSANHPNTSNNCELCHTVTPLLWSPVISPLNHNEVLGTCVSCHTPGGTAEPKSASHPDTTNNCELCHTVVPLAWKPAISPLNHNEVLGSCVNCHTPGGVATPKSNGHPLTTDNCELCHTTAPLVWTPVISPLNHNDVLGSCVSCHIPGGVATPKSGNHPSTSDVCEVCHTVAPLVWTPFITPLDHNEVIGSCVSCHISGGVASGKSAGHPNTTDLCDACHDVPPLNWLPFITPLDHLEVIGTCVSCHTPGGIASPKSGNHPPTTDVCEACHDIPPTSWSALITPLDHAQVLGTCVICHNIGGVGSPKSANHPTTTDLCDACHNVPPLGWLPFIEPLDHNEVLGNCVSCHISGGVAQGKSGGHPSTTNFCDACHDVPPLTWLPFIAPLDHLEVLGTCVSCHSAGGIASAKPGGHPLTTDICEACHNIPPTSWSSYLSPLDHSQVLGSCVDCHTPGGIAPPKSTDHPVTTDACELCHMVPPAGWSPFIVPFAHNAALGLCTDCHATGIATPVDGGHCTPLGGDCDICHDTTSFQNPTADCLEPVPAPVPVPPVPVPPPAPVVPPAPGMGGMGMGMGM